jgi:hypothetical protein
MNPKVAQVEAIDDRRLRLLFTNGERRNFDITPYLEIGVFRSLSDPRLFRAARARAGSVEWPGEIDLSYDTLYLESRP